MLFSFIWFLALAWLLDFLGKFLKGGLGAVLHVAAFLSGAVALAFLLAIGVALIWI